MKVTTRRTLRLVAMGMAVISAAAAGFLWALTSNTTDTALAALATVLCFLLALAVESLAANAEREIGLLNDLIEVATEDDKRSDEKDRELNRIIDMLSDQNTKFRAQLLHDKIFSEREIALARTNSRPQNTT